MKSMRLVAAAAILVLAACSSSATEPAATRAERPSFDGGNTMGSGNAAGEDGGGMMGSGNEAETTSTMPADTTGRGINTLGSGN
jgi:outer membrane biogenesis lipoprotein LolB